MITVTDCLLLYTTKMISDSESLLDGTKVQFLISPPRGNEGSGP